MRDRGYPVADEFEQRAADVSVAHPQVVEHYRAAHGISTRATAGEAKHGGPAPGDGALPRPVRRPARRRRPAAGRRRRPGTAEREREGDQLDGVRRALSTVT